MGVMDKIESWIGKKIEKKIEEAPKDAAEKAGGKLTENVWGKVCTKLASSEENQNRCKAASRLYDIALDGKDALASCGTAVGAGAAEVGTEGAATPIAGPVGWAALGSCGISSAKVLDSSQAMVRQAITGKETKTIEEQTKEGLGTYIKKKAKAIWQSQVREFETSEWRHFKELNPDATPADFERAQQLQDDFDSGAAFQ